VSGEEDRSPGTSVGDDHPQRGVILGAHGYASELVVDPSPLNDLLEQGWTFLSATPMRVDVAGGGQTGVVSGAIATLVIVEWRRAGPLPEAKASAVQDGTEAEHPAQGSGRS